MKLGFKVILISMVAASDLTAFAQTSIRGTQGIGVESTVVPQFRSLNGLAAWDASQGVVYNGTNVWSWSDLTGNGYPLRNTIGTGPAFTSSYGTNGFPALAFNGSQRLVNNSLGLLMNNKAPWTIVCLQQNQNSGGIETWAAGYSQAQTASASFIGLRPAGSPVTTCGVFMGYDTNLATVSASASRTPTSNAWFYVTGTWNGTQARSYYNLAASPLSPAGGTLSLDQFTLGGLTRTNGIFSAQVIGGVNQMYFFTNALTGSQITNFLNSLNAQRKVY